MAIQAPNTNLSANDRRILNALFDPETLPSSVASAKDKSAIDPSLPSHPTIASDDLDALEAQQKDLVAQAASTEKNVVERVWKELDEITTQHPTYPSAYLNRAMLRRIKMEEQATKASKTIFDGSEEEVSALFADLSRAIELCLPESSSSPVSPYQARTLRKAYSHRAYLYLKAAESGVTLKGKGKTELEEQASRDFGGAARYGDEVAREMSVRTNPYAKMCGAIVRNALAKERSGE
jgi:hypothetical protein